MKPRIVSLCSGFGGLDRAIEAITGGELVAYAEFDSDAASIMAVHYPDLPNLGDITTATYEGIEADVVCAGWPCQPASSAGKRLGREDHRWLWPEIVRCLRVLRPVAFFGENVRGILSVDDGGGWDEVLGGLADSGFDAEWACVPASTVGAPHRRERVYIYGWNASDASGRGLSWGKALDRQDKRMGIERGDHPSRLGVGASGDHRAVALLPTPSADESTPTEEYVDEMLASGVSPDERLYLPGRKWHSQRTLSRLAPVLFPTPTAQDGSNNGGPSQFERNTPPLNALAKSLPTPTARLGTPRGAQADRYKNPERSNDLDDAAAWAEREARWGDYAAAIERWESVIGREAPEPLEGKRLSARFVEWMMGVEPGWVTDHVKRNTALKILGNGVVEQAAVAAYAMLVEWSLEGA